MADKKQSPAKITEDQPLTVLVPKEKERYAIRKADWDRMKKNIKKSLEIYGDFTFLQKFYWVLGTFSFTLIPTTISLWLTSGVTRSVVAYVVILVCCASLARILYGIDEKIVREHKGSRLRDTLEEMNELEESLEKEPEVSLSEELSNYYQGDTGPK